MDFSSVKAITIPEGSVSSIQIGGVTVWSSVPDYLCFTAEESNSTVAMYVNEPPTKGQAFEFSTDGSSWSVFTPGTTTITLAKVGDKVYFRGNNITVSESKYIYYSFVMSGKIAASGNIMSLLDTTCESTTISSSYCFCSMFRDCRSLTTAPALPATTLADYCYTYMFSGCESLTTAPTLPSTTLAYHCYEDMFSGCTSLTTAPALPATTLASSCYTYMFSGCTSLQVYSSSGTGHTNEWRIPTSGTAESYTSQTRMFQNCPGSYGSTTTVTLNKTFYTQNTPV